MTRTVTAPKLQGETKPITFDFAPYLGTGETLVTAVVTASVYSGTDASPSSVISGPATFSGTIVTQRVTAGTVGVIYLLVCTVTTISVYTLKLSTFLVVIPDPS